MLNIAKMKVCLCKFRAIDRYIPLQVGQEYALDIVATKFIKG